MMTQLDLFGSSLTLVTFSVASDGGVSARRQQYKYRLALPHARTYPTSRFSDIFSWLGATPSPLPSPYSSIVGHSNLRILVAYLPANLLSHRPRFGSPLIVPPVSLGALASDHKPQKEKPVASACRSLQRAKGTKKH